MSLILDALRKMEQERKSRRGAAVDLRPEVLRYRGELKPKQGKPYLLVTFGIMLIAAGGSAGFLAKGKVARTEPVQQAAAPAIPAQAVVVAEPAPPAPTPAAPPLSASALPPTAPAADQVPHAAEVVAATAPPASSAKPARRTVAVTKASLTPPASSAQRSRPEPSQELQGSIPDITVSGIAWQEERSLRRAVLNGALVAEGAEVAGARVVEIKESRVRLSRGGQIFDVLFSSGLSSR